MPWTHLQLTPLLSLKDFLGIHDQGDRFGAESLQTAETSQRLFQGRGNERTGLMGCLASAKPAG